MNSYLQMKWPWIEGSHGMRTEVIDLLSDADLAFTPGGNNLSLGALCREMGEVEHAYIQSVQTFKQDFSYRYPDASVATSVDKIKAWYAALDEEMKTLVTAFSDADLQKTVDRGGFAATVDIQLDIYLQALLIFFGKITVYLKALDKTLPKVFQEYIG